MKQVPKGFWKKKENRVAAIKRLVEKLGKPPNEITRRDFKENKLAGVLNYYSGSPFEALKAAGYDIKEYEMDKVPMGYWEKEGNRVAAIKRLVESLGKPLNEITVGDFYENKLGGLITSYYSDSPF